MKYPKNIYVASADPMHYSHLNTKEMAEQKLGEKVSLVICRNALKEKTMFSLKERREMARDYLAGEEVFLAESHKEIIDFLLNAEKVVRGIRDISDYKYIEKIAKFYTVEDMEHKLCLIQVPDELKNISSTKIKELVGGGNTKKARQCCNSITISKVAEKLEAAGTTVELK